MPTEWGAAIAVNTARLLEAELTRRLRQMPPSMLCDFWYRLGLAAQREGKSPSVHWKGALRVAKENGLGDWQDRIQDAIENPPATPAENRDGRLVSIENDLERDLMAPTPL